MRTPTDPVIATRDIDVLTDDLCDALLTAKRREEMRGCSPTCARRPRSGPWPSAGTSPGCSTRPSLSYRDIHEATGVSTTTIVRVARFLRQEPNQGYRMAIDAARRRQ